VVLHRWKERSEVARDQEYGSPIKLKDGLQADPELLRNGRSHGRGVTRNVRGEGKTGNQTIDGLADGASLLTETPEIPRCLDR
jgi:hypothetical protein